MRWDVTIVSCLSCDFVFQSPGPKPEELERFFLFQYGYHEASQIDFSVERRVEQIAKAAEFLECSGALVDIGAGLTSEQYLNKVDVSSFERVVCCEPHHSADTPNKSVSTLENDCYSIAVMYDVLHHISNPLFWLRTVSRKIKLGGLLLIEVPNLLKYPKGKNFNFLTHGEILNHFSPQSLAEVAETVGFEVLEINYNASREDRIFGTFKKTLKSSKSPELVINSRRSEKNQSDLLIQETITNIQDYEIRLRKVREQIDRVVNNGGHVVIWGANRICDQLLGGYAIFSRTTIIDANPEKENEFEGYRVLHPINAVNQIRRASLFVFCLGKANHGGVKKMVLDCCARQLSEEETVTLAD
jgi:hypothetical protein